jgi:hypothetical protein
MQAGAGLKRDGSLHEQKRRFLLRHVSSYAIQSKTTLPVNAQPAAKQRGEATRIKQLSPRGGASQKPESKGPQESKRRILR